MSAIEEVQGLASPPLLQSPPGVSLPISPRVWWQCGVCNAVLPGGEREAAQHMQERHNSRDMRLVRISATTLQPNRHGLFDREAPLDQQHHQALVFPITPAGPAYQLIRAGTEVRMVPHGGRLQHMPGVSSPLHTQLTFRRPTAGEEDLFVERTPVSASRASSSRRVMWLGVGKAGHPLNEGDSIKLGSFTLTVRQVCLSGPPQVPCFSSASDPETVPIRTEAMNRSRAEATAACRICLSGCTPSVGGTPKLEGDDSEEGPLIFAPCLCRGNIQRVHLGCLREWLRVRYSVENRMENSGALALSFKPPGCEICRAEYPATYRDTTNPTAEPVPLLTNLPLVQPPFIVLAVPKSHGDDRERPHGERCVFAPQGTPDAVLRIGRQRGTELRLNDTSVSRVHAKISFEDGVFVLRDNDARFRTLVLPTRPEPLNSMGRKQPLSVQAGRTLLEFALLEMPSDEENEVGAPMQVDVSGHSDSL